MTFSTISELYNNPRRKFRTVGVKGYRGRFSILRVDDRTYCLIVGNHAEDERVVTFELGGKVIFHKYVDAQIGYNLYNEVTPSHHKVRRVEGIPYWYDSRLSEWQQWLVPFSQNDFIDADSKHLGAALDKKP